MAKCDFVDPSGNHKCGKKFQIERIHFINPTTKQPLVYFTCQNHAKIRFDVLNLAESELKLMKDKNQIKYQQFKDGMSEIWSKCRRCNESFKKEDVIWLIEYFRITSEIQISLKKAFRIHKDCAIRELFLYGLGKEISTDSRLDDFDE